MDDSLQRVIAALETTVETSVIWNDGLLNPGGPHRRLKGSIMPVSIGEDECMTFGKIIREVRPERCFIIGNAFGLSATYIADVMRQNGGASVITLDSQSEGPGERCAKIARELTEKLELTDILKNKKGWSPKDIPGAVEAEKYPLIFIDGDHSHPQVSHDFDGILPLVADDSIVVWHDSWIRGVPESVERSKSHGFRCLWVPTSCEMILGTRSPEMFERLRKLFPEGVEDRGRRSYVHQWVIGATEVVAYYWDRLRGR